MNAKALRAVQALYAGNWAGLDWSAGIYALASVESSLRVDQPDVAEADGSVSRGPWQINGRAWPMLPPHPLDADWNVQAAWIGPVITSLAYGLQQIHLMPSGASDPVWRMLPWYWRHGRSATVDRVRATRSGSPEKWITGQIDVDRQGVYERAYREALGGPGLFVPPPPGLGGLDSLAQAAGGWIALGFILFGLLGGGN